MIDAPQQTLGTMNRMNMMAASPARTGMSRPTGIEATDLVEISGPVGTGNDDSGEIRHDLVRRIRAEIADDRYLTGEKIDSVVEKLHRKLFRD